MSPFDDNRWFPKLTPKPPPEGGIKMKKTGATWWGQRWIGALEAVSASYGSRLKRGRTYARAGRTHDLVVETGRVTAKVTGSRPTPYKIKMTLPALADETWTRAIAAMAGKAAFAASLLAGAMPQEIDEAFTPDSLFPAREADLATDCSCPDWANPCKHVAATHYVLGEALDRDPFLLFELRGRTRGQVLAALREARGGGGEPAAKARIARVKLPRLTEATYDRSPAPLPALALRFEPPSAPGALLRQLGAPASWAHPTSPAEVLGPLVRAAAERARAIALAADDATDLTEPPPPPSRPRTGS